MTAIEEPFLWSGFFVLFRNEVVLHKLTQYLFLYTNRPKEYNLRYNK
jgi:hypothetical protein